MGSSLDVTLMYGYDLGGEEDGWKFNQESRDYYRVLWPAWVKLNEDGYPDIEDEDGFIEQAGEYLTVKMSGFTEQYSGTSDWYDRKHAADKASGRDLLDFDLRGANDYDMWTFGVRLGSGYSFLEVKPEWFDPATLRHYEAVIRRGLEVLELTFTDQPAPRILATSAYY